MNNSLLNKLAKKRMKLEKDVAIKETELKKCGTIYNTALSELTALKTERRKTSKDINLVCAGKQPIHGKEFKIKKRKRGNSK